MKKVEGEWQAVYYRNGRRDESRTYFATDKADAVSSARAMSAETGAEIKGDAGSLEISQVGELARELGFTEVQAAGLFRWYEYPGKQLPAVEMHGQRQQIPAYVRVQFYEPSSELQVWIVRVRRGEIQEGFMGNVASGAELEKALREAVRMRHTAAIEELVRWGDKRIENAPRGLVESAHSPYQEERLATQLVLADWLLDHGVEF